MLSVTLDFGGDNHLFSVRQGFLGEIDAAQHARHFLDPFGFTQLGYSGVGGIAAAYFVHEKVLMALGGHLRQVGDCQDLSALAQSSQQLTHSYPSETSGS